MEKSYKVDLDLLEDGFVAYRLVRVGARLGHVVAGTATSLDMALATVGKFAAADAVRMEGEAG